MDTFRTLAYVSSYLQTKTFPRKEDCAIFSKLKTPRHQSRSFPVVLVVLSVGLFITDQKRLVIKRPKHNTTGTTIGQSYTTSGQTSTTNGQMNDQMSTTSGQTSTASGHTSTTSG